MNIKNNNLLAIYLNEFNFDYLIKGAKKYKCKSVLKILEMKLYFLSKNTFIINSIYLILNFLGQDQD